jgi:hypothetical protein
MMVYFAICIVTFIVFMFHRKKNPLKDLAK